MSELGDGAVREDRDSGPGLDHGVVRAGRHAGKLYSRAFRRLRHPIRGIEAEAHHLHEREQAGDSGETPFIAVAGLLLFLVPVFALMLIIALVAARLFG